MIFFVFHAFNCVLRSLVIQLTISSLLLYAGHSIHPLLEIHSIVSHSSFGYHSIGPSFLNHSIDSIIFLHSIDSSIMPVVTRSMAKSVILLDSTVPASSLVTQDQLVSPSSLLSCFECGSDLPSSLVFQIPKISKFRNFKRINALHCIFNIIIFIRSVRATWNLMVSIVQLVHVRILPCLLRMRL